MSTAVFKLISSLKFFEKRPSQISWDQVKSQVIRDKLPERLVA